MRLGRTDIRAAQALALSASPVAAAGMSAAAFGVVWWLLALRLAPPQEAGAYVAVLGTAVLAAEFANLGSGYVVIRFLPTTGAPLARTALIVVTCTTAVTTLVGGSLIAALYPAGESLLVILASTVVLGFAQSWYGLGDDLLLALGRQRWILARTVATGLARVGAVLLVAAIESPLTWWLLAAAYSLPALAAVGASFFGLRKFLFSAEDGRGLLTVGQMAPVVPYAARSYSANLAAAAAPNALPPLVSWQLGPIVAAQYGVMWLVAGVLMLVPHAISATNLAKAARGEQPPEGMVVRAMTLVLAVQLPSVGFVLITAPLVFPLLNSIYAAVDLPVLAPLMFGLVCLSMTSQLYSRARMSEAHVGLVTRGQWLQSVMVLTLSLLLMPNLGLAGLSLAWLVAAATTFVFVAVSWMRLSKGANFGSNA